ncbi:hypothetical protein C0J52_12866 [Blattella germanica]|nr:hypothetical protein C0J52_12866 [Blattella germanica]
MSTDSDFVHSGNENDEELALISKGCTISFASSSLENIKESYKIIDGKRNTYWNTTGLYPHVFILTFPNQINVSSIRMRSYLVNTISVEKSTADVPRGFEFLSVRKFNETEHRHQIECLYDVPVTVRHLRFTIISGFDQICAIYKVEVLGSDSTRDQNYSPNVFNGALDGNSKGFPHSVGPFTSTKKQIARNSSKDKADELARMLNSFENDKQRSHISTHVKDDIFPKYSHRTEDLAVLKHDDDNDFVRLCDSIVNSEKNDDSDVSF